DVPNEQLNDALIVLWQFFANTNMSWFVAISLTMSISMGREQAKASVVHYGAERATLFLVATGSALGFLTGVATLLGQQMRLPFIGYLAMSEILSLLAAHLHSSAFGMRGSSWVIPGLAVPIVVFLTTPSWIERDRRQRGLMTEDTY